MTYEQLTVLLLTVACGLIIGNTLFVSRSIGVSVHSWRWWLATIDLWTIIAGAGITAIHAIVHWDASLPLGSLLLVFGLAGWAALNHLGVFNRTVDPVR